MDSQEQTNENQGPTEIQLLKERAKIMGIQHSPNIGVDKLRKKIDDKLTGKPEKVKAEPKEKGVETYQETRARLRKDSLKLIRCRIHNMNPAKSDLQGEIIAVGNKFLGTVRRFVPFGEATDNGTHVENILFEELKSKRYNSITTKRVRGKIVVDTKWVPEYNIEVLDQLTPKELKELAQRQAAAASFGD